VTGRAYKRGTGRTVELGLAQVKAAAGVRGSCSAGRPQPETAGSVEAVALSAAALEADASGSA
jgi:hypothetical protein